MPFWPCFAVFLRVSVTGCLRAIFPQISKAQQLLVFRRSEHMRCDRNRVWQWKIFFSPRFLFFPYFLYSFHYIYCHTVTEEEKYIVNTSGLGVWQRCDRVRQAMGDCLSQVDSQVMGWQVTSTTNLSDPYLQFPVRSVLRRAGPTLFYFAVAEGGYPARQAPQISPPGMQTGSRRQAENMPARPNMPRNVAVWSSYFVQKTNPALIPCPPMPWCYKFLKDCRLSSACQLNIGW